MVKTKKKNVNLEGNNTDLANNFNVYVSTAATKLLQDLGDVPFSTEINYCENFMVVVLVDENYETQVLYNCHCKTFSTYNKQFSDLRNISR